MTAILDIEIRKSGPRKGRGWALRYAPDASHGFMTLPKLPRGVQQGRVSFPVAEGLVYMEDCHGARSFALVRTDGSMTPATPAQAATIKRSVAEWVGRPDLPPMPPAGILTVQTDNFGWVARITGRDAKWGLAREFLAPCDARTKVKVFSLTPGVWQVKGRQFRGPVREVLAVYPDGRCVEVDTAWVFGQLAIHEAREARVAATVAAFNQAV